MKKAPFQQTQFLSSIATKEQLPVYKTSRGEPFPEIALVGRSNVGKSSLLNHFLQKKIAKTSSTPGKTQTINFFLVDDRIIFVDLPGFGYAKVPLAIQDNWSSTIDFYLNNRPNLLLLLHLLDIRRIPSKEDLQLFHWASSLQIPTCLILTKSDKVGATHRMGQAKEILSYFPSETEWFFYSTQSAEGRLALTEKIHRTLKGE